MLMASKKDPMWWFGASFAISILAFGAMFVGGWGPCGPAHLWQFLGFLTGLLALTVAALSLVAAVLLSLFRFIRRLV